ncbi:MAG: preprotein translocase subunit SecG [Leptospirales bacterium]
MEILSTLLTITFVVISAILMLVILMQSSRSSGMGLFGGSSQSAFGASSGDILTKVTGYLTAIFLILALSLAFLKSKESALTTVKGGMNMEETGTTEPNGENPATTPAEGDDANAPTTSKPTEDNSDKGDKGDNPSSTTP